MNFQREEKKLSQILLLGASGSGKRAFLEQLAIVGQSEALTDEDRAAYVSKIRVHVLTSARKLLETYQEMCEEQEAGEGEADNNTGTGAAESMDGLIPKLSMENRPHLDRVMSVSDPNNLTQEVGKSISALLNDSSVRIVYEMMGNDLLTQSSSYFFL